MGIIIQGSSRKKIIFISPLALGRVVIEAPLMTIWQSPVIYLGRELNFVTQRKISRSITLCSHLFFSRFFSSFTLHCALQERSCQEDISQNEYGKRLIGEFKFNSVYSSTWFLGSNYWSRLNYFLFSKLWNFFVRIANDFLELNVCKEVK